MPDEPDENELERKRQEDLRELAARHEQAIWEGGDAPRPAGSVNASMDVGPGRRIASDLRALSVQSRAQGTEVPRGSAVPGVGSYILGLVLIVVFVAAVVIGLIYLGIS